MSSFMLPPVVRPGWLLFLLVGLSACAGSDRAADESPQAAVDSTLQPPPVPAVIPRELPVRARASGQASLATPGRYDAGRMWTFDNPPEAYLRESYGFDPDEDWWRRARLGALRLPGCSASFVSPHGLVLTNYHCVRRLLPQLTREGEDLVEDGFYAETLPDERPAPQLYVDQLVSIEDVTGEVATALDAAQTAAEREVARQEVFSRIEARLAGAAREPMRVEVVPLYNGGRYSAYVYRRFEDVRLVFVPESDVASFGGDFDNFTYPRYSLDMALLRVYTGADDPHEPEVYFPWSEEGAGDGDLVFAVGNPGSTSRLETVAQLLFRRDVTSKATADFFVSRVEALERLAGAEPEAAEAIDARGQLFTLQNARKVYLGELAALEDPQLIARRRAAEQAFLDSVRADPELQAAYGELVDRMAALQEEKRELAADFGFFLAFSPGYPYASSILRRALLVHRLGELREQGAPSARIDSVRSQLAAIGDLPASLERDYLTYRLEQLQTLYGLGSELAREVLGGRTPEEVASEIVSSSSLARGEALTAALDAGTLDAGDPALSLAAALVPRYEAFQRQAAGLGDRQEALAAEIGRAKYAVYGDDLPPDATFTLRISDGIVSGYPYNGTIAPPHTTIYGLYDHYYSYGGEGTAWDLPERWLPAPPALRRSAPINFVSTNDTVGGSSGSPVLNRELELVGLLFDGNIESLVGDYLFLTDRPRSISVDARGMLEALRSVYEADRLVRELRSGELARVGDR